MAGLADDARLDELAGFLRHRTATVRQGAAENLAKLSGSRGGVALIVARADSVVADLCALTSDEADVATPALRALVNVVANEAAADAALRCGLIDRLMDGLAARDPASGCAHTPSRAGKRPRPNADTQPRATG